MITLDDLKKNAKFRAVMFLDMEKGGYLNSYVSQTYPRLSVNKSGSKGKHYTTYFVDNMECPDLDAVLTMLNASPVVNIGPETALPTPGRGGTTS